MRPVQRLQGVVSTVATQSSSFSTSSAGLYPSVCLAKGNLTTASDARRDRLSAPCRCSNGLTCSFGHGPALRRSIFTTAPRAKKLKLPPRVRKAPNPADLDDALYTPADSGLGLEEVGGLENWFENPENWSEAELVQKYGRKKPVTSPEGLEKLVKQAVAETVLKQERKLSPKRQDGEIMKLINKEIEGEAWRSIPLDDLVFKFKVAKRLQKMSGHLVPDGKLVKVTSVGHLFNLLVEAPKPKKLAEELEQKGSLELANVSLYNRRVTPVDKEKMVGRWKVIVDELEKRELPVLGHGGYQPSVEEKWSLSKH